VDVLVRGVVVEAAPLDYAMPKLNGGKLVERARRLRLELPILFMTGFAEPDGLWSADAPISSGKSRSNPTISL